MANLAPIYTLAELLGCKVEIFVDNKWSAHQNWVITQGTPIRVTPESEYQRVLDLVPQFYDIVQYKGYEYYVPQYVEAGDVVIFFYGFGVYAQKQADGSYIDLEQAHDTYRDVALPRAFSRAVFFNERD